MELRHLRYFCAVAEHKSFTQAAGHLNVSQSGVSGQIRDLEREIGVKLFRRNQREVALTPQGILFWDEAREILLRADRVVELVKRSSKGEAGKLAIGLCGPVTASFLPALIRKFRTKFPGVTVSLRERVPSEQVDALINREIDVGFTRGVAGGLKHLVHQHLLFRESVVVALPSEHPLAKETTIPVASLASRRLLLYERKNAPEVFDGIVALFKRARVSTTIADTPSSWQTLLTMVEAGEGVGLVPECVQQLRPGRLVFRPLAGKGCRLEAIVVWRQGEVNAIIEQFLTMIRTADFSRP